MEAAAIVFAINVLTSIIKRWVYPKYGSIGVQIIAFILALIGASYYLYGSTIHEVQQVVGVALTLFSLSVAFYEVILSRIPLFKGEA